MSRPGFEADKRDIKIYVFNDGHNHEVHNLTAGWDRSPSSFVFSHGGNTLFLTAEEGARYKIFELRIRLGESVTPGVLVGDHANRNIVTLKDSDSILYLQSSLTEPTELYRMSLVSLQKTKVTQFNSQKLSQIKMSQPEEFTCPGAEGDNVQSWLLKPANFDANKKYPTLLLIHGGPQGAFLDQFHYRWNLQAFAAQGYAVIATNFHGSTGFGQKFTDSISGDWGGKPYQDLMKSLDYAFANYKWLDEENVGALGASYGGYMINWLNGNTKRFKCFVNHDG